MPERPKSTPIIDCDVHNRFKDRQMSALWPVARLIEQGLGLRPGDDIETSLDRLRSGLAAASVDLPDAVELVGALLGLVHVDGASMAPERRMERTLEALDAPSVQKQTVVRFAGKFALAGFVAGI